MAVWWGGYRRWYLSDLRALKHSDDDLVRIIANKGAILEDVNNKREVDF